MRPTRVIPAYLRHPVLSQTEVDDSGSTRVKCGDERWGRAWGARGMGCIARTRRLVTSRCLRHIT